MQSLGRDEFLGILGVTSGYFDQLQHEGHAALAFGAQLPGTPGRYCDLDLVAMAIALGLTPQLGRDVAASIVSRTFHQWAAAVGRADADRSQEYFMGVAGVGWNQKKRRPLSMLMTHGAHHEIADDFKRTPDVVGYFCVNISDILARIRRRAEELSINLDQPFFFAPDNPRFGEIITQIKDERDRRSARARASKKKPIKVRADIRLAPRVKDAGYPIEMGMA